MIKIYTDGACSGNPGRGGWAAIIIDGEKVEKISGASENTTNNRMELIAVISALKYVQNENASHFLVKCFSFVDFRFSLLILGPVSS